MKKLFFTFLFLFCIYFSRAQGFHISFHRADSAAKIDYILVTNNTSKQQVKILEDETLLLSKPTGFDLHSSISESDFLFPNPCTGNSTLFFYTSFKENVTISIYNIQGKLLSLKKEELNAGFHQFHISFPSKGVYLIRVLKNNGFLSLKAVSTDFNGLRCNIDYIGNNNFMHLKNADEKIMNYSEGDLLLYSAFSGVRSTKFSDSPNATKIYSVEFFNCIDISGNNYPVVKIGNQWWMAKNLAYLPFVSPPIEGSETYPHYYVNGYEGSDVYFAKSFQNYAIYGVLYNWPAVMGGEISSIANPSGVRGICPSGWHVPSDAEWEQLAQYINNQKGPYIQDVYGENSHWHDVGGHLKSQMGWHNNNYNTDDFGFTGLPGGMRSEGGAMSEGPGIFLSPGPFGVWWSSTALDYAPYAYYRDLNSFDNTFTKSYDGKIRAFSVRCVKDN